MMLPLQRLHIIPAPASRHPAAAVFRHDVARRYQLLYFRLSHAAINPEMDDQQRVAHRLGNVALHTTAHKAL